MAHVRQIRMPDNRLLDTYITGPDGGTPLIFHSGTPSAGPPFEPMAAAVAARGLRLVTWSRPGYAASTRLPGRTVADVVSDVSTVLDDLDADRCFVVGWSGGGPHALATAALLPRRVSGAATIASVAPYPAEGLDWLAGMGAENVEEFGAALAGPNALELYLEEFAPVLREITPEQTADALGDLIPDVDRDVLTGEFAAYMATSLRASVSTGIFGWFDDDLAFTRAWGFQLADISVPVWVWQGQHDRMVPFLHGQWLVEHIPTARPHLYPDHGHLSLAVASFGQILDKLISELP